MAITNSSASDRKTKEREKEGRFPRYPTDFQHDVEYSKVADNAAENVESNVNNTGICKIVYNNLQSPERAENLIVTLITAKYKLHSNTFDVSYLKKDWELTKYWGQMGLLTGTPKIGKLCFPDAEIIDLHDADSDRMFGKAMAKLLTPQDILPEVSGKGLRWQFAMHLAALAVVYQLYQVFANQLNYIYGMGGKPQIEQITKAHAVGLGAGEQEQSKKRHNLDQDDGGRRMPDHQPATRTNIAISDRPDEKQTPKLLKSDGYFRDELKSYMDSDDKYINMFGAKADDSIGTKNLFYLENSELNFHSLAGWDDTQTELLIWCQNDRKILLLRSTALGQEPRILEKVYMQFDERSPVHQPKEAKKGEIHLSAGHKKTEEKNLKKEQDDIGIDFNSIDKNAPKKCDTKRKDIQDVDHIEHGPLGNAAGLGTIDRAKIDCAELALRGDRLSGLRTSISSRQSSAYGSYFEDLPSETGSLQVPHSSQQDEKDVQEKEQKLCEETARASKDADCEREAAQEDEDSAAKQGSIEGGGNTGISLPQPFQATQVESEDNENFLGEHLDTNSGAANPVIGDTDSEVPGQPDRESPTEGLGAENHTLRAPIQASSPPADSFCVIDEYADVEHFSGDGVPSDTSSLINNQSSRIHTPSGSAYMGAVAQASPVVARENRQRGSHGSQPVQAQSLYHGEVYSYSFTAQAPAGYLYDPPAPQLHFSATEAIPSPFSGSNIIPSERESSASPAPLQLPPITLHRAGSLPPWATQTARIDLSQATDRPYTQLRSRRATYGEDWPDQHSGIDAANVALAGFFRRGPGRRVRCFFCGLELELSVRHNVWDEHVRHSPTCAYLRAVMGSDFVLSAQSRLDKK